MTRRITGALAQENKNVVGVAQERRLGEFHEHTGATLPREAAETGLRYEHRTREAQGAETDIADERVH